MVYIKRKERETTTSMLRRFSRRVQQSGVLVRARKNRFFLSKPTRRAVREKALRRMDLTQERERLEKLGRLPAEDRPRR